VLKKTVGSSLNGSFLSPWGMSSLLTEEIDYARGILLIYCTDCKDGLVERD
jgi:hypothetical protein